MSDWKIEHLENRLERLDSKVWKESNTTFMWLMILSNVLFWVIIGYLCLRQDVKTYQASHTHVIDTQKNVPERQ